MTKTAANFGHRLTAKSTHPMQTGHPSFRWTKFFAGTAFIAFFLLPWCGAPAANPPLADAEWDALPQGGRVTLKVKDCPLKEVMDSISKQAGFRVEWDGPSDRTISLSAEKTPFMALLASMCRENGWGMQEYQSADGRFFKVQSELPIKSFQARGPLVLAWYGLAEITWPQKSTKYRLGIIADPLGHVQTSIEGPLRERPVTFVLADGRRLELKSDHDPNTFTSGVPTWQFDPGQGLAGEQAAIEINVPALLPSRIGSHTLAWADNATGKEGEVNVKVETVKAEKKQETVRDISSADFMKKYDVQEFSANLHLVHSAGELMRKIQRENRQPTAEEQKRLEGFPEGGVLAVHQVWLAGGDGTRLRGILGSPPGMSVHSPWDGYRSRARFQTKDAGFVPKELVIVWAEGFRRLEVPFRIEKAPLK